MDNFTRAIDEGVKVEYIFRTALMRWGSENQIIKACEELAELSAALLKYVNTDDEQRPSMLRHIREEMADAEIMLERPVHVEQLRSAKLYELANLIEGRKYY